MKMKEMSILLMALLMITTPALAFPTENIACDTLGSGCHAFPPVFLNNSVSVSNITVSPGQTFPVTITWTGGVTAGTNTVAKWPNAVLDNALFNPTPQMSAVGVFATGSLTSTLTAPIAVGNYTLRAYASDGTGTPNNFRETDFKEITVQVAQPANSSINLTKTPSQTQVTSGTSVTYTYVVTNTGGTTLTNVSVSDDILGSIGGPITLDAGASQTFTKSQVITANTTNIGTASGTDPSNTIVTSSATATVTVITVAPTAKRPTEIIDNMTGIPVVNESTVNILAEDFMNFTLGDQYTITITRVSDGVEEFNKSGTLMGLPKETIAIDWIPKVKGDYILRSEANTMAESRLVLVINQKVVSPVPELSTIVLLSAGLLGLFGLSKRQKKD